MEKGKRDSYGNNSTSPSVSPHEAARSEFEQNQTAPRSKTVLTGMQDKTEETRSEYDSPLQGGLRQMPSTTRASIQPERSVSTGDKGEHEIPIQRHTASQERSAECRRNEEDIKNMSLREVAPVTVEVRNLTIAVDLSPTGLQAMRLPFKKARTRDRSTKTILDDVSASLSSGSLTAIIGASGSGKTSMLNAMAQRMNDGRLKQAGTTLYNSNRKLSSVRSAYVMQQDVLLPTLTVRETLQYSADLRLPPPTSSEERRLIVEEVILELGLKECANTRIGNNERRGCSGGEKRRTSLAVQLLANPSVLFLDEVTTGLDTASAFQLVKTLRSLARKGRTIILPNGKCPVTTGEEVLQLYHLDTNPGLNVLALGICAVVYRIVAYLLLKAKKTHWGWKEKLTKTSSG